MMVILTIKLINIKLPVKYQSFKQYNEYPLAMKVVTLGRSSNDKKREKKNH